MKTVGRALFACSSLTAGVLVERQSVAMDELCSYSLEVNKRADAVLQRERREYEFE